MLNNEPFTRYLLRQIYPFAHEIIVAEGATPFSKHVAREDGHSSDGTLEELRRFKEEEDPDDKLRIVVAEDEGHPDGFWPGEKEEMCGAFAKRATGDWLWQVDGDEFYSNDSISKTIAFLKTNPQAEVLSFRQITFWGSLDYRVDGPLMRGHATGGEFTRLFKWGQGFRYTSHRPPTVCDDKGVALGQKHWLHAEDMEKLGVGLMHYSLLFPHKVRERNQYYVSRKVPTRERDVEWGEQCWLRLGDPFRVHNVAEYPAWLESYDGEHPEQVVRMWGELRHAEADHRPKTIDYRPGVEVGGRRSDDRGQRLEDRGRDRPDGAGLAQGGHQPTTGQQATQQLPHAVELRDMSDVEALMRSWRFRMCRAILRVWPPEEIIKYRGGYRLHQMFYSLARMSSRLCANDPWRAGR